MTPTIPVFWLSRHPSIDARGPWDTRILESLFAGKFGPIGVSFEHIESAHIDPGSFAVVVLPARHHVKPDDIAWLNAELAKRTAVLLILCGDEEGQFPWQQIEHQRLRWWVQMPTPSHYADLQGAFWFGNGAPHGALSTPIDRPDDFFFAGQATHRRRKEAIAGLKVAAERGLEGQVVGSDGFAKGLPVDDYLGAMGSAWFIPCPSGPKHQDTFRVWEALESCSIPLADAETPTGSEDYWTFAFGEVPFPTIRDWNGVAGWMTDLHTPAMRQREAARCAAWWTQQKRQMADRLRCDLSQLGVTIPPSSNPTVIVTTSPSPTNPDVTMIVQTVASALHHWPAADVIVACDGVRPEQAHMIDDYAAFQHHLAVVCMDNGWTLHISNRWLHQAALVRDVLECHDTSDVLLMLEHDTPLVIDEMIDADGCFGLVLEGTFDVLRFHHEAHVLPDHQHLMIDTVAKTFAGVPAARTVQWSQRPHLARRDYYYKILTTHFSAKARCFIEDRLYGIVLHARPGKHRIAIYCPAGGNIKRSYHLDGRKGGPKFDESQVW